MGVGIFGVQQALIERLSSFGEADKTIALSHLKADAVAFVFVAAHLAVGFLVTVGSLDVLLASKGQVGVFGRVSSLRVNVAAHKDEQGRHDDKDVSFHRQYFSFSKRREGVFIIGQKYNNSLNWKGKRQQKNPAVSSGILCKQFRRLIMMFYHLFLGVSSMSWSFLLPFIKT